MGNQIQEFRAAGFISLEAVRYAPVHAKIATDVDGEVELMEITDHTSSSRGLRPKVQGNGFLERRPCEGGLVSLGWQKRSPIYW